MKTDLCTDDMVVRISTPQIITVSVYFGLLACRVTIIKGMLSIGTTTLIE